MTVAEKAAVEIFLIEEDQEADVIEINQEEESSQGDFMKDFMKQYVQSSTEKKSKYQNINFIPSTSNICEKLFSICFGAYDKSRRSISVVNFEAQIFLKVNYTFWDRSDVAELLKRKKKEER